MVSWQAPCTVWVKANFEDLLADGKASGGVLFNDSSGRPLLIAGKVFEAGSVVDIELKAAWLAMSAAYKSIKEWPLILEGGSQQMVKLIKERNSAHYDHPVLVDIGRLATEFPTFEVRHMLREGNSETSWVANFSHTNQ